MRDEQEHLVVHRQTESEDEDQGQHQGIHPGDVGGVEVQHAGEVSLLEPPDQDADGCAERQRADHAGP